MAHITRSASNTYLVAESCYRFNRRFQLDAIFDDRLKDHTLDFWADSDLHQLTAEIRRIQKKSGKKDGDERKRDLASVMSGLRKLFDEL